MAVTRLKRKDRKNKSVAKNKVSRIQHLNSKPVIKNVDVEAIAEGFSANSKKAKPTEKKEQAPKVEVAVEAAVVEEVKEAKPKKAPKAKKEEATEDKPKKAAPKKAKKEEAPKAEEKSE
jgi:hypothetical protein